VSRKETRSIDRVPQRRHSVRRRGASGRHAGRACPGRRHSCPATVGGLAIGTRERDISGTDKAAKPCGENGRRRFGR
jgi:hypothetical protein